MEKKIIEDKLLSMGAGARFRGFDYIVTAMCLIDEDPRYLDNIGRYLYPEIGYIHGTSVQNVERNIRNMVEQIYVMARREDLPQELIPGNRQWKLSNKEFLSRLFMFMDRNREAS